MKNTGIIVLIVVLILAIGGYYWYTTSKKTDKPTVDPNSSEAQKEAEIQKTMAIIKADPEWYAKVKAQALKNKRSTAEQLYIDAKYHVETYSGW